MRVFISYRRDDTQFLAGRIRDALAARLGDDNVFFDVDSIPLGMDFRAHLRSVIAESDAICVLIGPNWASERLADAADVVRVETATGLASGRIVVPVLVGEATLPDPATLPADLSSLPFLQAHRVRTDPDFHRDVEDLFDGLQRAHDRAGHAPAAEPDSNARERPTRPPNASTAPIPAGAPTELLPAASATVALPTISTGPADADRAPTGGPASDAPPGPAPNAGPRAALGLPRPRLLAAAVVGVLAIIALGGLALAWSSGGSDDGGEGAARPSDSTDAGPHPLAERLTDGWSVSCEVHARVTLIDDCRARPAVLATEPRRGDVFWLDRADWIGTSAAASVVDGCEVAAGKQPVDRVTYRYVRNVDLSWAGEDVAISVKWAVDNRLLSISIGGVTRTIDQAEQADPDRIPYQASRTSELTFVGVGGDRDVQLTLELSGDGCTDGLLLDRLDGRSVV